MRPQGAQSNRQSFVGIICKEIAVFCHMLCQRGFQDGENQKYLEVHWCAVTSIFYFVQYTFLNV